MNIVLLEPEIPTNTANIGKICLATNTKMHLIEPLGFKLTPNAVQKAKLDYDWEKLNLSVYMNWEEFVKKNPRINIFMASTKATQCYTELRYPKDSFFLFGKESAGIPEELLVKNKEKTIRIPMYENQRSLNLSNSVAVILYEALRQHNFENIL